MLSISSVQSTAARVRGGGGREREAARTQALALGRAWSMRLGAVVTCVAVCAESLKWRLPGPRFLAAPRPATASALGVPHPHTPRPGSAGKPPSARRRPPELLHHLPNPASLFCPRSTRPSNRKLDRQHEHDSLCEPRCRPCRCGRGQHVPDAAGAGRDCMRRPGHGARVGVAAQGPFRLLTRRAESRPRY